VDLQVEDEEACGRRDLEETGCRRISRRLMELAAAG
jgi:hypothetical protein